MYISFGGFLFLVIAIGIAMEIFGCHCKEDEKEDDEEYHEY